MRFGRPFGKEFGREQFSEDLRGVMPDESVMRQLSALVRGPRDLPAAVLRRGGTRWGR